MSDLLNQYRADFIATADRILRSPGVPKKVFAYTLNHRFIEPLRQQNVDEGTICELRDEAFRIFEQRRAVNNNRRVHNGRETLHKRPPGNKNKDVIRYGDSNVVERVNGVRR